jgi:CRP/FNR family cyclic AMP-dependent transcriptional regulator
MFQQNNEIFSNPRYLNSPWLLKNNTDWSFLKEYGIAHLHKKNEIIVSSSEPSDSIYYIESGRVRTSVLNEIGEEKIILVVDKGNIIDLISVLDNLPNYLFCTAVSDCLLYEINKNKLLSIMENDGSICFKVRADLSQKLRIMITEIQDLTFMSSYSRVAKYIYRLGYDHGQPYKNCIKLNVKFTHEEMAIYAGTCRVTASNILESLVKRNIISKEDGYVIIKDVEGLKNCVDSEYPPILGAASMSAI